jgi:CBS domain-containing protein
MLVRDVMISDVSVVAPEITVDEAAQIMADLDIDGLPVGRADALCGILTAQDIILRVVAPRQDPRATRVEQVMSKQVYSCAADAPVAEVLAAMAEHQVRRMPVLDAAGKLVGLVMRSDLERAQGQPETERSR